MAFSTSIAFNLATDSEQQACGELGAPAGRAKIVSDGASCKTARDVMTGYFSAVLDGQRQGNSCVITIRGYTCSANTAAAAGGGVAARCRTGEREIEALT